MTLHKVTLAAGLSVFMLLGAACKTFVIEDVDYSQSVESVLTPNEDGMITDFRHGIQFNILPIQYQEFNDSSSVEIDQLRMIRNAHGFYFITAERFNHVYVMEPTRGELKLKSKIKVSENGLQSPAFNLRNSSVQLVEIDTENVINLDENGVQDTQQPREEQS